MLTTTITTTIMNESRTDHMRYVGFMCFYARYIPSNATYRTINLRHSLSKNDLFSIQIGSSSSRDSPSS